MKRILVALLLLTAVPALAQEPVQPVRETPRGADGIHPPRGPRVGRNQVIADDSNAPDTARRLQELLREYPPSLSRVLALDPTLLTNDAYLQPYPQLATYLGQHPDIAHNPTYYFDQQYREMNRRDYDREDPRAQVIRAMDQIMGGLAALTMGLAAVFAFVWVIRTVIEHRKWLRVSKTHVDTHAKLMDRLTSNEDLMAYMQSPAGRRFLEAAPIPLAAGPRTLSAPLGRIFWSVQAGLVVAALGIGLVYASRHLGGDFYSLGETPLFVVGIAALAVGFGFFVSALMAYGMSSRLGLFDRNATQPSESGPSTLA